MTQLEQYKKAYAALVGQIDDMITSLEKRLEPCGNDPGTMYIYAFAQTEIFALTKMLQDAEEIFLDEDPEDMEEPV